MVLLATRMKMSVLSYLGITAYIAAAAVVLVVCNAPAWIAAPALLAPATGWLLYQVSATKSFVLIVSIMAALFALVWQAVAHTSGIWYEISLLPQHLFGIVPLESVWSTAWLFLFCVGVYEYFVDDQVADFDDWSRRRVLFLLGGAAAITVVLVAVLALVRPIVPLAFSVLLGALLLSLFVLPFVLRGPQYLVIEKVLLATGVLLPMLVLVETVAIFNGFVVYGNPSEYLASVVIFGELIPLEKLLAIVVVPAWVLLLHEWFLDDAR